MPCGVARLLGLAPALHAVYRGVDRHDVLFDLLPGVPFADAGAMGPSSEMSSGVIWVRVVS